MDYEIDRFKMPDGRWYVRLDDYLRVRHGLAPGEKPTAGQRNGAYAMGERGTLPLAKFYGRCYVRWEVDDGD